MESLCEGSCIDTQTDPLNCGACAHNCYGGACLAGVCQPASIASAQLAPFAIAVDSTNVYWTNHIANGSVVKMALAGGEITTLANGLQYPSHITVDAHNVYWTSTDWATYGSTADTGPPTGGILMMPIAGGGVPITLATGLYAPDSIVTNGAKVVWDDWGNFRVGANAGSVSEAPTSGAGPVTTLASGQFDPTGLALSGTNLYWCNQNDYTPKDGVVFALPQPLVAGTENTLAAVPASGTSTPVYLAIDTVNVYWTDFDNGLVMAEPLGGGTQTTLATGVAPYGIAADGANVYWSDWGNGTVMKVTLDGGVITTLATAQDNPLTIAVDNTRVYWASYNRGTVLSIAK
jgi:sugar lactone lactonase YvrE